MKDTLLHKIAMLLSLKPLYASDPNYKNEIPAVPCTRHLECSSSAEYFISFTGDTKYYTSENFHCYINNI